MSVLITLAMVLVLGAVGRLEGVVRSLQVKTESVDYRLSVWLAMLSAIS